MFKSAFPRYPRDGSSAARRLAPVFVLAAAVVASCVSPPLLNSERIERRFGSYVIDVLVADDARRISSLASREGDRLVTRTLAMVTFPAPDARVAAEHARVVAGESIGAVFRDAGWHIGKPLLHTGTLASAAPAIRRLMNVELPATLALHAYRFVVSRDGGTVPYATIVELHHPAYLSRADVERIHGGDPVLSGTDAAALEARVAAALDELRHHGERLPDGPAGCYTLRGPALHNNRQGTEQ